MPQTFKIELELISDDAPNPNKRTHIGKVIGTVQSIISTNKLCKKPGWTMFMVRRQMTFLQFYRNVQFHHILSIMVYNSISLTEIGTKVAWIECTYEHPQYNIRHYGPAPRCGHPGFKCKLLLSYQLQLANYFLYNRTLPQSKAFIGSVEIGSGMVLLEKK